MNIFPTLFAKLVFNGREKIILYKGFEDFEWIGLSVNEIDSIRDYLLLYHTEPEMRSLFHIEELTNVSGIRRDSDGKIDGSLYRLWQRKLWEIDTIKKQEDSRRMDARVKEYSNKEEALELLTCELCKRMAGIDKETARGMVLGWVLHKQVELAKALGVDISELV